MISALTVEVVRLSGSPQAESRITTDRRIRAIPNPIRNPYPGIEKLNTDFISLSVQFTIERTGM
jgi:hypothetical protein